MSFYQPKDEILSCGSESCGPSATPFYKSVEAGTPRSPEVKDAASSNAMAAERNAGKRTELTCIATELPDLDFGDPVLDPNNPDFDVYKWAQTVMRVADRAGVKFRRVSFAFRRLVVLGSGSTARFQTNAASIFMAPFRAHEYLNLGNKPGRVILHGFDGVAKSGEMLLVLGRPGSGCSTFLKTVSGELHGLKVDPDSEFAYNGIPQEEMIREHKGEIIYNSEVDKHFPHLTVRETLQFAATVRTPHNRVLSVSRRENIERVTAVAMAICGLAHVRNTKVGNDFIRGVSGGERKRVSIAEMILAASSIGCWDNSTRGLDSSTALEFVRTLRTSADIFGTTHAVAIYQASQAIYTVFDKVMVLYEGREIYFGPTEEGKAYFEEMGWYCPPRQTTADFLTSVTSHEQRRPRQGFDNLVPRTPEEFEQHWRMSQDYKKLLAEIQQHERELSNHVAVDEFRASRRAAQSQHLRVKSPYVVSIPMQVKACITRARRRLWNDKASTLTVVLGQVIMALVVGSVFYGTAENTDSFFAKGSTLFFATLLNALIAVTEINGLYQQRPIVEKHASYAFCHPSAEAFAGIVSDAPVKLVIATCFNLILYFLAGLRPEPSQFFIFFLFTSLVRFSMSAMFRTVAACTRTISQALAIAGVLVLAIVIYTGYTIPRPYMHPWFRWLAWINPLAYAFEALMVNEFHGREFLCASLVPSYFNLTGETFICPIAGAVAGQESVSGDAYVMSQFQYSYSHIWRNLGIVIAFWMFFLATYLLATGLNSSTSSTAEVLIFLRDHKTTPVGEATEHVVSTNGQPDLLLVCADRNEAHTREDGTVPLKKSVLNWCDVVYDIRIKGETRRLLDHVSGWVKPGTLTALMGVSGAGKTTLLDVLAQRISAGVVTGDILVNGKSLEPSFQRRAGYVQQQDVHLETSTVREALRFSALLRQPASVSTKEKYAYVEDVIKVCVPLIPLSKAMLTTLKMLDMEDFSEAIVGVPGQGLNVEQRKRLSIGVELAAKPALLIFLDEPTSGLDAQSSCAIVGLLRKLANSGQAILATIHQPSSILFLEFDCLLFLGKGGKTVYFGDIGSNSKTLLTYFERHGARPCGASQNPAEYILEMVTAKASDGSEQTWPDMWRASAELAAVKTEHKRIRQDMSSMSSGSTGGCNHDEFATPLSTQILYNTIRAFQQYWRSPSYIWGKFLLGGVSALFIGFSFFQSNHSLQGMQNAVFSIFMLTSILSSLVQQIMPRFIQQRSLYEVRERPSKVYSWAAFILANIMVEIPYQLMLSILVFACYNYPVFGVQSPERQALVMLFVISIFIFASTFAHMVIAALPDAQTAGTVATLLFSMTMIFNGVFQPPQALPGFWIFMYRVSPLTYIVGGIAATGLHDYPVHCSASEISVFDPPDGFTCGAYLEPYLADAPGQLLNPAATVQCHYCPLSNSDQFLSRSGITWVTCWQNLGIVWAYIAFNIGLTITLYYVFRVKGWSSLKSTRRASKVKARFTANRTAH